MADKSSANTAFAQLTFMLFVSGLVGCGASSSSSDAAQVATLSSTPAAAAATAPAATASAPATTPAPKANTASGSTPLSAANNSDACLASPMPATSTLFNSSKRVFAHYLHSFPASIDNVTAAADYYNKQYLSRTGESDKWLKQGGFLRSRPLGITPSTNPHWKEINMMGEVRAAIARGITGFTFDSMAASDAVSTSDLHVMLAAAADVDTRFKIIVMPDIAALGNNADAVVDIIASVASSPAAYHLSDGRLVVSPFDAGLNSVAWWQSVINRLTAQGIHIAFVPTFLTWSQTADAYAALSYGFSDWGSATTTGATGMEVDPGIVHSAYKKIFMAPADPQQYRPKSFAFWEASNSAALRDAWTSSIQGDADWVQVVTWNDYSESSAIAPITDSTLKRSIGTGFYDLTGYYSAWFLTGQQPKITHDVLYYFYRREPTTAAASGQSQKTVLAAGTAENNIELLAFLTSPGVLKITIGGKTYTQNAAAGIVSFKIPSQPGTPLFALERSGADVFTFQGGVQIYGPSGLPSTVQDLTYWSGSAAQSGICSL